MKTEIRIPAVRAPAESPKGLSQLNDGVTLSGKSPEYTRKSATTANTTSTPSSAPSRITCDRAESSMPV